MGEDRTRDEEPGREMEGDTVMTMNTRDNSNQKEPISLKKNSRLSSTTVLLWEKRKALKGTVAWWRLYVHAKFHESDDFLLRT